MGKLFNKLALEYQNQYNGHNLYDSSVLKNISKTVQIHNQAYSNPLSSAASCLNVLGSLAQNPVDLLSYLNALGIKTTRIYKFPTGANVGGRIYDDIGYVLFEWIGPEKSPIYEVGGKRGQHRTSIDAYIIAEIEGKTTQLIIEWKFTEGCSRPLALERFSGLRGVERLRRYASVLASMRKEGDFPFTFEDESGLGLYDLSPDHLYQLLRMTLLAKTTTPCTIGNLLINDYRVIHLSHSQNSEINVLHSKYLISSPGLRKYTGKNIHEVWMNILSNNEKEKFIGAYWDEALWAIKDEILRTYLITRY